MTLTIDSPSALSNLLSKIGMAELARLEALIMSTPITTFNVLANGRWTKMPGIYATRLIAEMIQYETDRNRFPKMFKGKSMSVNGAAIVRDETVTTAPI